MGKFENTELTNPITSYEDKWDGHSGMEVEDYITRDLERLDGTELTGGSYENEILKLNKKNGESIEIPVTVQEPTYSFGIYIYGLKVDDQLITRNSIEQGGHVLLQYKKDKKFQLGVAIYATSVVGSNIYDRVGPFPVKIKYGGGKEYTYNVQNISHTYFKLGDDGSVQELQIPEEENIENVVKWIDVNDIFTMSQERGQIQATIVNDKNTSSIGSLTTIFPVPITIQIIQLSYTGDIVVNSKLINFNLLGSSSISNYILEAYGPQGKYEIGSTGLSCYLHSGLNQIAVRAYNREDSKIKTDWLLLDLICTVDCNDTVIAVNNVNEGIKNNSIATLYNITIYSPDKEDVNLVTYLSQYDPSSGDPEEDEQLKKQVVTSIDYNDDNIYSTSYYKYIENLNSTEINRFLLIKYNDNKYQFIDQVKESSSITVSTRNFKVMTLSPVNYNYCFYNSGVRYSFDQIKGYINDVFITPEYSESIGKPSNISPTIEVTDGWREENGVISFKTTAQKDPILTLGDLQLGNDFTLEVGLKTYNVSDEAKPFMTLGKLQFRPTSVCWDVDMSSDNAQATFDSRNAIFQEDVRTHITITVKKGFTIKDKNEIYYPDYLHSFQQDYDRLINSSDSSKNKFNLVRVFIDDVIDREFIITDEELATLKTSSIVINPTTTDVDYYLLRVYNQQALDYNQIQQNYISYLSNDVNDVNDDPKTVFYDKNDILDPETGEISFTKAYKKYNTLALVFPLDPIDETRTNYFPSRAWGGEDNVEQTPNDNLAVTMFIGYADPQKNKQYGGRAINLRVRDQGTSASRYFIWNVDTRFNKGARYVPRTDDENIPDTSQTEDVNGEFVPYVNLDESTNRFIEDKGSWQGVIKKGYVMPPYDGRQSDPEIKSKKNVGKVNYASSMQSHKAGFCNLYDDFYQSKFKIKGRKAVQEEPFLYFYWYTNKYYVDTIELQDLLDADANNSPYGGKLKFMGFQTWGSAKKDDETSGYDDDATPGYLMLEGGENDDIAVNFRCPWQELQRNPISWEAISDPSNTDKQTLLEVPQIDYAHSLEKPWDHLWISGDESIIYNVASARVTGAWDVDYGLEEVENEAGDLLGLRLNVGTDDEPNNYMRESVKTFREFYDLVYTHDTDIVITRDGNPANWTDKDRKYCCTNTTVVGFPNHKANDVYRYNGVIKSSDGSASTGRWVPAGVKFENGQWSRYNLTSDVGEGFSSVEDALEFLKQDFKDKIKWSEKNTEYQGPLDTTDAAIHQAMIRFISGTDNRAKNTYFTVRGPYLTEEPINPEDPEGDTHFVEPTDYQSNKRKYHYVGFLQDDVDTILATDNNGLQTKPYNILEPSYRREDEKYWGDRNNTFFKMFDLTYETEINSWLDQIITFAFDQSPDINNTTNRFYKYFFSIQDGFPAIAYNHTSKIYYELAQLVLDIKAIPTFRSNDQDPIEQSHGSCINSEKQYMKKRLIFLGTQCKNGTVSQQDSLSFNPGGTGGSDLKDIRIKMEFEPYQDYYPTYKKEGFYHILDDVSQRNQPSAIRYLAQANKTYQGVINTTAGVNNTLNLISNFKKLTITGLQNSSLGNVSYKRAVKFVINNNLTEGETYPATNFTDPRIPSFPVVEEFSLVDVGLPETFDASTFVKLKTLNLSGTNTKYVILPSSGRLETVILPETITRFEIYNNPGLLPTVNDGDLKQGIVFEGIENLESVNIDCSKCGNFDVNNFCESLIQCNSLKSITLKNANLFITQKALNKIIGTEECNLTGTITIVVEPGEQDNLYAISFQDKQLLVNRFGNISSPDSTIKINFQETEITDVQVASEVSIYKKNSDGKPEYFPNMVDLQIPYGNDVEIINEVNPYNPDVIGKLNITYKLENVSSSIAEIDQTGGITLKSESSISNGVIVVTVTTINRGSFTKRVSIKFQWTAPQIGDLAYADGTFSTGYNSNKTLVGIVFAKDEETETTGTVHIMGKEYVTDSFNYAGISNYGYYLGYSNRGEESDAGGSTSQELKNLYQVSQYLLSKDINDYEVVSELTAINNLSNYNDIKISTYTDKNNDKFCGKSDTLAYVNHVNSKLLKSLISNPTCSEYIKVESQDFGNIYYIENLDNLNLLCDAIKTVYPNISSTDSMTCLLYPYFYSAYLYQPTIKDGETLDPQYKAKNWYCPSLYEQSRVIYYRGYSARGLNFNTSSHVRDEIDSSLKSQGDVLTTPIFSTAKKVLQEKFPTVWTSLVGSGTNSGPNNIVTSVNNSESENYSYQCIASYSSSITTYVDKWIEGDYNTNDYYEAEPKKNAWRFTKHKGIPFVQFKYSKS